MRALAGVVGVGAIALAALGLQGTSVEAAGKAPDAASAEFYTAKVQPILETNCYKCHGGMNHRGGLSMATRDSLLKGGHHGAAVVPGDPAASLLIKLIRHEGPANDPMPMPPKGDKLSDGDIATVTDWIKAGAVMPPDVAPKP